MLFGVLYVVFTEIVRIGHRVPHYPVMLLSGIVIYQFFSEATSAGLSSLVDRENLLRKVSFPRASIPIAVTLTAAANLALGLVVVVLLAFIDGVEVRATWLLVVPVVLGVIVFAMSISMLLSVLYVRFRDARPIWEVFLQLFFWGSPIIYTIETIDIEWLKTLVMCSPLSVAIQQVRHWLVDANAPSASEAIGGGALILIPIAIFFGLLVFSYWMFVRTAPHVAEDL
jgi:ABC-2 type transport system permease protein